MWFRRWHKSERRPFEETLKGHRKNLKKQDAVRSATHIRTRDLIPDGEREREG